MNTMLTRQKSVFWCCNLLGAPGSQVYLHGSLYLTMSSFNRQQKAFDVIPKSVPEIKNVLK